MGAPIPWGEWHKGSLCWGGWVTAGSLIVVESGLGVLHNGKGGGGGLWVSRAWYEWQKGVFALGGGVPYSSRV